ncbi:MAG: alpha/beta fold hydrolase [Desulfocapsaceae bacterium]
MLFEYNFTSNYLELTHGRLHYLDEGDGDIVVLVHGNPTWSYYYRNLVKKLSLDFRVIVPDHLGCGLSEKPRHFDYSLENHIDNLLMLLQHLGTARISMVVHDWGGPIGLGTAAAEGIKLEKLVILNTAAFRATRIPFRIRICGWPFIGKFLVQGLNGFARAAVFMAVEKQMTREVAREYLRPYDSWDHRRAVYEFVKDIPLNPAHRSYATLVEIEKSLETIKNTNIPTSIFWGGKDFCFNDYFYSQWKARLPQAECHYFKDWGHYILEDGKGQIEPAIDEFLCQQRKAR